MSDRGVEEAWADGRWVLGPTVPPSQARNSAKWAVGGWVAGLTNGRIRLARTLLDTKLAAATLFARHHLHGLLGNLRVVIPTANGSKLTRLESCVANVAKPEVLPTAPALSDGYDILWQQLPEVPERGMIGSGRGRRQSEDTTASLAQRSCLNTKRAACSVSTRRMNGGAATQPVRLSWNLAVASACQQQSK